MKRAKEPQQPPQVRCSDCKHQMTDHIILGRTIATGEPFMCWCDKLKKYEFLNKNHDCKTYERRQKC